MLVGREIIIKENPFRFGFFKCNFLVIKRVLPNSVPFFSVRVSFPPYRRQCNDGATGWSNSYTGRTAYCKKKQINGSGDKPANGNVVVGLGRERYYCEDMRGEWVDRSVYGRLCYLLQFCKQFVIKSLRCLLEK